ncbi:hypothetical protein BJ742DRAFT_812623 [Cladochytrium replicatum]|nr:hypothetical protein BJ742DRAFT_812623 [Cladochytrium replicatum]
MPPLSIPSEYSPVALVNLIVVSTGPLALPTRTISPDPKSKTEVFELDTRWIAIIACGLIIWVAFVVFCIYSNVHRSKDDGYHNTDEEDLLESPEEVVERVPTLPLYAPPEGQRVEREHELVSPPYYVSPTGNTMTRSRHDSSGR